MIALNDYLYRGDTILKIIQNYSHDLKKSSVDTGNAVDMIHSNYLLRIEELLIHNDFLTSQSQRIREFYKYMSDQYPFLAFTFKGRIKSLMRAEEKFNGYIMETIADRYSLDGTFPEPADIKNRIDRVRDLIAYRIVISLPKCHMKEGLDREEEELKYLFEIANILPEFLGSRGFCLEFSAGKGDHYSDKLKESVRPYIRDYITNPSPLGYKSLHLTLYDLESRCFIEVQLRTKDMDDYAKIGPANHLGYEQKQKEERTRRGKVPEGVNQYFEEAFMRAKLLQEIDLTKVDVNMFTALSKDLINDGCGLCRGRLILPYEHLSRFQNDVID